MIMMKKALFVRCLPPDDCLLPAVVVTTYNTLGCEWGGRKSRFSATGSPLSQIKWVS
jgi:hypothetical protein